MQYCHKRAVQISFSPSIDIDRTFQKEGNKLLNQTGLMSDI